jgi:3-oxoacyl-[acyl-carrier-protein] synthase II
VRTRVVITGIGVVSPNGIGASTFADACIAGISGLSRPDGEEFAGLKTSAVAAVRGFDPLSVMSAVDARRVPRMIPLALAASREAMSNAKLSLDPSDIKSQRKIGVALGTGGGGLAFVEEQYRHYFTGGSPSLFSITAGTHGNLSSELSIALRLRGPSHVLSTGCTSSTDAIGYATMLIRSGVTPMMLAGGADSPISPGILHAFEKMRVVSTRRWDDARQSSRPFSADRDGFVLGEGAWMFILESLDHAESRGATPIAEILGYASTCDAFHRVQIAPDVAEPVRAIEGALADASLSANDVDYVNLHGTSTELNDRMETLAMHRALGSRAKEVPMSSTKSMIGHPQGACGAAGLAATVLCLQRRMAHPTINLDSPDPDCDLNYVANVAQTTDARVALCNCIAFGSKNSAVVVEVEQ